MTEARLSRAVQLALRQRGAFVFKIHGNEYMMTGLPDLIVCYQGKFIGMELKQSGQQPTRIQTLRLQQIQSAGGYCGIVHNVAEAITLLDQTVQ